MQQTLGKLLCSNISDSARISWLNQHWWIFNANVL